MRALSETCLDLISPTARAAAVLACLATASLAHAQDSDRLSGLILSRIEGDRSHVCVQAARIDLTATSVVHAASACATHRPDAPPLGARFEIGSISKAFVGVLAAEMAARGELKHDEPLAALLPPDAGLAIGAVPDITLADLLTHTSGLPSLPPGFRPAHPLNPYANVSAPLIYGGLAQVKLPPREARRYAYSNWAFLMLSDLLARRAGKPFDVLLRERVLAPLGMHDTLVARNDGLSPGRFANGVAAPPWDVPVAYAGAGGLRSTIDDMARFARAMLGDVPDTAPPSLQQALRSSREKLRDGNAQVDLGWGWHLRKRPGAQPLVFHNGMTYGASAMLVLDIAQQRGAITLADAGGGFDDLALRIVDGSTPLAAARRPTALDLPLARAAAGRYQLAPNFILTMSVDDNRLYAQATGQDRFELLQDARGEYYTTGANDILIRLRRGEAGKVEGLTLFQGGGALPAPRLE
jgi:CubicO group peptidase (beta-lactamase class C family)